MDENFSIENLNTAERIELAIKESRRQQARITELINSNMNETRPVVIEENRKEIERLTEYHKEYDEMTKNGYLRYMNNLNDIINRLTVEKAELSLSDKKEIMLRRATEQRNRLLELSRDNMDILFYIQPDKKSASVNPHSPKNPEKKRDPKSPETIEAEIQHFNEVCDKIEKDIVEVLKSLAYDDKLKDVTSLVSQLDEEFAELKGLADELRTDIGEFKDNNFGKENFSLSITAMERKLTEFRKKLREIKKTQMEHYNSKVEALNVRIRNIKNHINDSGLSEEDKKTIANLVEMNLAQGSYFNPGNLKYLSSIDYDKLLGMTKTINDIEKRLHIVEEIDLEDDMKKIEDEVKDIDSKIKDDMSQDEINALFEKIGVVSYLLVVFNEKLNANKDKLSEAQFTEYEERAKKAKEELDKLREKIGKIQVSGKDNVNHDFEGLKRELDILEAQVDIFSMVIRPNSLVESDVPNLEGDLKNFETSLEDISNRIEEKHNEGKIDDNQFNTLMEQVNGIKEKIEKTRTKINDPKYVKNYDIFDRIKNLELNITQLEELVDSLEAPIKDKNIRNKIDKEIARLETEIKMLRLAAEKLKEKEPEKYKEAMQKIDEQEKRLEAVAKKYKKKCPFLVKTAKTAKELYKKHKKVVLIAAGLASVALIHATVGPVLGPAIMHGNIMLMSKIPALRPVFKAINAVIGKLVGAKVVNLEGMAVWQLANGVIINPSCAAISLLKGIAISGLSSAAIAAPIVIMAKELIAKMKKFELREKLAKRIEKKEKEPKKPKDKKETIKKIKEKVKEKVKDKSSKRKEDKEYLQRMKDLLIEYRKSKLSLDEFAEQNELSSVEKGFLEESDVSRGGR